MTAPLSIALVSPHSWPATDDITWRIAYEAEALARRGHGVTILTPCTGSELIAEGRARLSRLREGDTEAVTAPPGDVLLVPLGRALPAGPGRRVGGPLDLAAALEDVLSRVGFDVVHVHEPLAPSPALAALRHTGGVTAATFYRPEQLAGVAFVRPLVERAVGRVDVWISASENARRIVQELFVRDCTVLAPAVDPARFAPARATDPPALTIVTRTPDRAGVRFALSVLRELDLSQVGPITLLGPREAPWRTRAAIPKALRDRVTAMPDDGPDVRAEVFAGGGLALFIAPDDMAGSAVIEALACGLTVLTPRCRETEALITHGHNGLALPAFSRDAWIRTVSELIGDPERRGALGAGAVSGTAGYTWDAVALELEALYHSARHAQPVVGATGGRAIADLRVMPGPDLTPRDIVDGCLARGVDVVAVISREGIDPGRETANVARSRLTVIVGQQIATADGDLVGLFLASAVADGQDMEATMTAIHGQGGIVMVPHPVWGEPPSHDLLRRHRSAIDCYETLTGPTPTGRAGAAIDATLLSQRYGLLVTAGSGATTAEELGSAHLRLRPFASPREFLDSLVDGEPVQRRRGLRSRSARERRHPGEPAT